MKTDSFRIENFDMYILQHENECKDYVRIEFERDMGRSRSYICVPRSELSKPAKLYDALIDAGAHLEFKKSQTDIFVQLLTNRCNEKLGQLCNTTGWKKVDEKLVYLLGSQLITGSQVTMPVFLHNELSKLEKNTSGSLLAWKNNVGKLAVHSHAAATAILVSLAAPLLKFSKLTETFVINFAGNGSTGKSTSLRAGASIWRDPTVLPSWNITEQGLNEELARHNDNCIILDDTQQGAAAGRDKINEFMSVTHRITHGNTRKRSITVAPSLPTYKARALLLSSSPEPVSSIKSKHGGSTDDGDRARFLEINICHGSLGGIWVGIDPKTLKANSCRELSERLSNAAKINYGRVGKVWIKYLVKHQSSLEKKVTKLTGNFISQLKLDNTDSVKARIAQKIALIYAAGIIAIKAGVLPWKKAQVLQSANHVYKNIIKNAFSNSILKIKVWDILYTRLNEEDKFIQYSGHTLKGVDFKEESYGINHTNKSLLFIRVEALKNILKECNLENKPSYNEAIDQLSHINALHEGHGDKPTQSIRVGKNDRKIRFLVLKKDLINAERAVVQKQI